MIIVIGGAMWSVGTGEPVLESMWIAWTFIADPGTHSEHTGILKRLISLGLTLGGMCIFAVIIGTISDSISTSVDNLRKGKSRVIESNHTLILGQGDKLIPTIRQISLANASCGGGIIVVMTTTPKEELEITIREANLEMHGTEVIVRTGVPHIESDLRKVSAAGARSVIVLADRGGSSADIADVNTVRTVLSLRGMQAPKDGHIVSEVCDVDDEELVRLVGRDSVETIVSHDIIGRLMIQCALETGLAQVLETLLGFEDNEFYINNCEQWKDLFGLRFDQLMFRFENAVIIGFLRGRSGKVELNPPEDSKLLPGDSLVVIAEDDDTYSPMSREHALSKKHIAYVMQPERTGAKRKEKMLFVGWRRDMDDMILQLDQYVTEGSQLTIYTHLSLAERESRLRQGGMDLEDFRPPTHARTLAPSAHSKSAINMKEVLRSLADEEHDVSERKLAETESKSPDSKGVDSKPSESKSVEQKPVDHRKSPPPSISPTPRRPRSDTGGKDDRLTITKTAVTNQASKCKSALAAAKVPTEVEMHLKLNHLEVFQIEGNQTSRKQLDAVPLETYDSILILADEDLEASQNSMDMVYADSRSLTTLLLIRDMQIERHKQAEAAGGHAPKEDTTVISEILDPRTKTLLHTSEVSDYVTSNELVSMAIAMVAEQRTVNKVLKELFSTHGNQILVKPITNYVKEGAVVSFWEIMWIAKSRQDLLIGFKTKDKVYLNPPDKAEQRAWMSSDELVILREVQVNNARRRPSNTNT
eukprot:CAMPEP_0182425190 /NCGR_PEP_ID=MMETSP1167-20130531/11536_1 /TAXON_ID=2988 /ORGANISM="Mallomonas Sp, Strain CCMP3275" /LENGTH=758 /DNA_ID=CAMNT_0024605639 /DNA_START=649 /DNA_END=2925 /DNA_ORIENTATION=+